MNYSARLLEQFQKLGLVGRIAAECLSLIAVLARQSALRVLAVMPFNSGWFASTGSFPELPLVARRRDHLSLYPVIHEQLESGHSSCEY